MPRKKKTEITATDSQIELFDYSSLDDATAKLAKESAIEIKAREKAIWENIIMIGNKLVEVKNALPHGQFQSWVEDEFKWSDRTARKYMKVAKELDGFRKDSSVLPNGFEPLYVLASGLSKIEEEEKQQILDQVEEKAKQKGEPPTEKEIKEILQKKQENSIKELKEFNKNTKLITDSEDDKIAHLAIKFDLPKIIVEEVLASEKLKDDYQQQTQAKNFLNETIDNQNKQIKELNSSLSAQEKQLQNLDLERQELELKQLELDQQIEAQSNIKADEILEKERKENDRIKKELEKQKFELERQSQELKSSLKEVEKTKANLKKVDDWLETLQSFNQSLNDHTQYITSCYRKIIDIPNLDILESGELDVANKKIYDVIREFHDNNDKYGRAIGNLYGAITKIDKTVLKTIDVDKEIV